MQNINLFIKDNVKTIGKDVYVTPEIPEKKLNNAIKAYKCESFYESILAIYDDTVFGSAKDGLVFTGEKMIHSDGKLTEYIYNEIQSAKYIKEKGIEYVKIIMNDSTEHKFKVTLSSSFNYDKFAEFLNKIVTEFENYEEEDQLKEMADMPNELKVAYLKIIINMTFIDDEEIDEKELAELFLLMTRLKLDKESRFEVRAYITEISHENLISVENLLEIIKNNSEVSHYQSLMISLAKDLINTYFSTNDTMSRDFAFLDKYKDLFELSDAEIDLAYDTVENDYKLLKEDLDDDAITKNAKELASKAAAAGAPLAAVYISGSVVGMSAAGITSGLATLGMGMTGGLAVIGIIGVLSYKGVQHLTGANELDKYKTRELMLHEVIKQTQKTISLIIDDVNYIVQKLNDTILNHADQTEKIKKLTYMVAQFQGALKSVDNKSNVYQNSANRLQSPKILDDERLKSLTEEPTKKPLYDFVIENYELKTVEIDNEEVERFVLKENVKTEILDKMAEIFKALGYFDMDNILKSKASGMMKGIFG